MDISLEITAINYLLSTHWGLALKKKKVTLHLFSSESLVSPLSACCLCIAQGLSTPFPGPKGCCRRLWGGSGSLWADTRERGALGDGRMPQLL